jgi:hypothetical protein
MREPLFSIEVALWQHARQLDRFSPSVTPSLSQNCSLASILCAGFAMAAFFRPESHFILAGESLPTFDQKSSLAEVLLTLMKHGEFSPVTKMDDEIALTQFCDWVGEWKTPDRVAQDQFAIPKLVEELTDRFGLKNLWQRMLPGESG